MGKVILVGATKGGVGKSVSSYNLAYSLVSLGKKVLAIDFDTHTDHRGVSISYQSTGIYDWSFDDGSDGR